MSNRDFKTARLTVTDWRRDLDSPEQRQALEAALEDILTGPVLAPLPPPLQFVDGHRDIPGWMEARATESDVYCIRQTGAQTLIGILLLADDLDTPGPKTIRIGYLLAQSSWGKGYATELISGLVAHLEHGEPVLLMGGVASDNPASARVLEKAGFTKSHSLAEPYVDMFVQTVGQPN